MNATFASKTVLASIKTGSKVRRMLGGEIPMDLIVTEITDREIVCSHWKFCRNTGGEIDKDLGWDGVKTGSFLTEVVE